MRIAVLLVFVCLAAPAAPATVMPFDQTPTDQTRLPSFADRILTSSKTVQVTPVLRQMGMQPGKTAIAHASLLLIYASCMVPMLPSATRPRKWRRP